jgi:tetratricopeptide (TPR) repeat protein
MAMTPKAFILSGVLVCSSLAQSPPDQRQQIETHIQKAREFLKNNQTDLAAREFKAVVLLDPNDADARNNLGVLLFFRGDYAHAVPQLRAAVKLQPTLSKTQALLGMCEKRTGETGRAEADLTESLPRLQEENLKVQAGIELVELHYGAGDLQKAAVVLGVLRQLRPTDPEILYTAYRIYSAQTDEAILGIAMSAPGSAHMHQVQAHELARQGVKDGAIAHYREALKIDPRLPGAHFELAEMLAAVQDGEGALKEYQAALAVNAYDAKSECRLGESALRISDTQTAARHFTRALQLRPNDIDGLFGLAKALVVMDQPEKAQPLLEQAVKVEPFDAVIRYQLAMVYRRLHRTEDSRRELAAFQKLKEMKEKLNQTYRDMRLQPKPDRSDSAEAK